MKSLYPPALESQNGAKARWGIGFVLLLLGLTIVAIRWLTFDEAFERDLTTYAVIAHEMLAGRPLYSEMWDIKPPGIYLLYAGAERLVGYGRSEIFLLGVGAALITLAGVYRAVVEATGDRLAGLWAGFFWVLVCSNIDLQANQPNTEVFLNAAFIWGLALFIRAYRNSLQSPWPLLGAGCIWAAATLVKQIAFTPPLLLGIALVFWPRQLPSRSRFLGAAALIGPTIVVWSLTFAYFALTKRWEIFTFTMIDVGRIYAIQNRETASHLSFWISIAPQVIFFIWPLLLLTCLGLVTSYRKPTWWRLALGALAIQIAVYAPGPIHPHYYQLWLPMVCLAAGFSIAQCRSLGQSPKLASGLAAATAFVLIGSQYPYWTLSSVEVSQRKYASEFVNQFALAPQIARLLSPNQTLYQYGFDSAFYFVTKRRPPVGILCLGEPKIILPTWFHDRILSDLKREKPQLVQLDLTFPHNSVTRYIDKNYVLGPESLRTQRCVLLVRRNSKTSSQR